MLNEETKMPRMADMNGKDMWMAMFKVSLPIYRRKTNASIREAQLMQNAAAEKYASQRDALESQWLGIVQRAEESKRKIRLLNQQLDLVDRTLELMRAEYVAETTLLSDLLETDRQRVALALKLAEAKARFNTTVAQMEKIAALNGSSLQTEEECRNK
jgi:outer membrane protein TolC